MFNKNIILFSFLLLFSTISVAQKKKLVPFQYPGTSKWGYRDSLTRKVYIFWHFDRASAFKKNGIARVELNSYQTYIDTNGKMLFPFTFKNLPEELKDTIIINSAKDIKLIKIKGEYWEFKTGVQRYEFPASYYFGVRGLINSVRVFNKSNARTVEELTVKGKPKPPPSNNLNASPSILQNTELSAGLALRTLVFVQCATFLNNDGKMQGLAVAAGFNSARRRDDSFNYRINQMTLGLVQRFRLSDKVSVDIGLHPVLRRNSELTLNTGIPKWISYQNAMENIQVVSEFALNIKVSKNSNLGYIVRGVPLVGGNNSSTRFYGIRYGYAF